MSITSVTSEALQLKLRELLPSQLGFGTDLSASDTIIPIIDLTAAAEGSALPQQLQEALSFSDITSTSTQNGTDTIINTTGFWLITYTATCTATNSECTLRLKNGVVTKNIFRQRQGSDKGTALTGFFTVFLQAGDEVEAFSGNTNLSLIHISEPTRPY